MSYAPPSQPTTVGTRSAVGSADNDAESTFRAAVDAMQIGGMGTLEVIARLSNSGANAVIRMAYYSIDADGTETFEHMDAAQTATATAQSATATPAGYIADTPLLFPTYGYDKARVFIDSISAGTVTIRVKGR